MQRCCKLLERLCLHSGTAGWRAARCGTPAAGPGPGQASKRKQACMRTWMMTGTQPAMTDCASRTPQPQPEGARQKRARLRSCSASCMRPSCTTMRLSLPAWPLPYSACSCWRTPPL